MFVLEVGITKSFTTVVANQYIETENDWVLYLALL